MLILHLCSQFLTNYQAYFSKFLCISVNLLQPQINYSKTRNFYKFVIESYYSPSTPTVLLIPPPHPQALPPLAAA